jgi:nitrate reductase NapAB chaperone NapD
MPIKSYLAHPHTGKKQHLIAALSAFEECEVMPAQNEDVLVLVTETSDDASEELLKEKIEKIESLKLLAMVSGFNTPQN